LLTALASALLLGHLLKKLGQLLAVLLIELTGPVLLLLGHAALPLAGLSGVLGVKDEGPAAML
jgi:hypothetical protein